MKTLKYFVFNSGEVNEAGGDWNVNFASPAFPLPCDAAALTDRSHAGLVRLDNAYASQLARFGLDRPLLPKISDGQAEDLYWPSPGQFGYIVMPWNPEFCLAGMYTGASDHRGRPNISLLMAAVSEDIRQQMTPQEFFSRLRHGNDVEGILKIRASEEQKTSLPRPDELQLPDDAEPLPDAAAWQPDSWPDGKTVELLVNGHFRTLKAAAPVAKSRPPEPEPQKLIPARRSPMKFLAAGFLLCAALGGWAWYSSAPEPSPQQPVPAHLPIASADADAQTIAPQNADPLAELIARAVQTGCTNQNASCTVYAAQLKNGTITVISPALWAPAAGGTELEGSFATEPGGATAVHRNQLRASLHNLFAGSGVEYVPADTPKVFSRSWQKDLEELKKSLTQADNPTVTASAPPVKAIEATLLDSAKGLPEGSCLAFASALSDGLCAIRLVSLSDGSLIERRSRASDGYIAAPPKKIENWIGRLEGKYRTAPGVGDGDNGQKILLSREKLPWDEKTWKKSVTHFIEELIEELAEHR